MADFDKFKEEVAKLDSLLKEGEAGCSTWHMILHDKMSNICKMYYGYVPSTIKPLVKK